MNIWESRKFKKYINAKRTIAILIKQYHNKYLHVFVAEEV